MAKNTLLKATRMKLDHPPPARKRGRPFGSRNKSKLGKSSNGKPTPSYSPSGSADFTSPTARKVALSQPNANPAAITTAATNPPGHPAAVAARPGASGQQNNRSVVVLIVQRFRSYYERKIPFTTIYPVSSFSSLPTATSIRSSRATQAIEPFDQHNVVPPPCFE